MFCNTQPARVLFCLLCIPAILLASGCDNTLSPYESSTTETGSPDFKADITINTLNGTNGRLTNVLVQLFDVFDGDEHPITLVEGDTISATTEFSGKTYDFRYNIEGWFYHVMSDTDATVSVTYDPDRQALAFNPAWTDTGNDVIAVLGSLYHPVNLNTANASLDVDIPQAYIDDGHLQLQLFLRDSENVDALVINPVVNGTVINGPDIAMSDLNGNSWNTISVSNINTSMLQADTGFDPENVFYFGLRFVSNGQNTNTEDIIEIDNAGVTLTTPIEQPFPMIAGLNSTGEPTYGMQFNGGLAGLPLTISVNRQTPPTAPWFPSNDSPEPDFSDFLFNAPDTSLTVPDIEITSPASNAQFTRGVDDVTIQWVPTGADSVKIAYSSICDISISQIQSGEIELDGDTGTVTYPVDDFLQEQKLNGIPLYEGVECSISITLIVTNTSENIDPAFSQGEIGMSHQSYPIKIISVPPPQP